VDDIIEVAKIIESLTGVPFSFPVVRRMTRKERQEQAARVRRFLALPVSLQEGALEYAEKIRKAYSQSQKGT